MLKPHSSVKVNPSRGDQKKWQRMNKQINFLFPLYMYKLIQIFKLKYSIITVSIYRFRRFDHVYLMRKKNNLEMA